MNHQHKKNRTDISFFPIAVLTLSFLLTISCKNEKARVADISTTCSQTENASEIKSDSMPEESNSYDDTPTESSSVMDNESRFGYLRNNWTTQVMETELSPTVIDFMNTIMNHYAINKEQIEQGGEHYEQIYDVVHGYCSAGNRMGDDHIFCAVWNRKNGHLLIPFLYGSIHGDWSWCFYDYNPQTKELALDAELTDKYKDKRGSLYNKYGFSTFDMSKGEYGELCIYIWNGKDFNVYTSEEEYITKMWTPQNVKAISRSGRPSVVDFMRTFTDYLGYTWTEDEFYKVDMKKGYCSVWSSNNVIECVIWNRNNQHVLICISLVSYLKDDCNCGPDSFKFLFFDYDPKTKKMSAESGLTEKFKPIVYAAEIEYEFGAVIPVVGKDIKIENKIFKWNGYDFDFPK